MGFGYNRYALVLAALTTFGFGFTTAGCSGGGSSGGGFASTTTAPTTSATTSPTTTATSTTPGPILTGAEFLDSDNNNMVSKGDKVVIGFDSEVAPITTAADPSVEFKLSVLGDTFGKGATILNSPSNPNKIEVVLGDAPVLHVTDAFDLAKTIAGAASGVNVSTSATSLTGVSSGVIREALAPVDIAGTLQPGFMMAGSLNVARGGHAAVTLDDGRVLVVGGVAGGDAYVRDAELFDPVAGTWTVVSDIVGTTDGRMRRGSIDVRMVNASAVKLNDGTVLICGGYGIEKKGLFGLGKEKVDTLESAFIFDPSTNAFSKVGDMNYSRHSHTATLMADGRVLIAGGYNDSLWSKDKTQAPFEIFDPAKRSFEKSGSIFSRFKSKEPRMNHSATAIEGGTGILLTGGNYYKGGYLFGLIKPKLQMCKGSEVVRGLDTQSAGDLNEARMSHAALATTPRNVLIAGGHNLSAVVGSLELYDVSSANWTTVGNLARPRTGAEMIMDGHTALVLGGSDGASEVADVEAFDADAKVMMPTAFKMNTARNNFTVSKLADGRILVVGGMAGATKSLDGLDGQGLASCEVFVRQ